MQRTRARGSGEFAGVGLFLLALSFLLYPATSRAVEFTSDTTISSSQYSGEDLIVTGCTLTIDCSSGRGNYRSLWVRNSGRVTHPAGSPNGLWLAFSEGVTVDGWCTIDVSGRGYGAEGGPGPGANGTGGTHGGNGQDNPWPVYDSITAPSDHGSGGGHNGANPGAPGGGSIRLEIGGTLTLNGHIFADGAAANFAGSGAGGSVYITCTTLAGGANIYARGGDSGYSGLPANEAAGGGGGGRIAIIASSSSWSGSAYVHGGYGQCGGVVSSGGPGTIYWRIGTDHPVLTIANAGRGGVTVLPALNMPDTAMQVRDTRGLIIDCTIQPLWVYSLLVTSNSTISHIAGSAEGLRIITVADLQVDGWCYLDVSGKGYAGEAGPGAGSSGAGGAHGGNGQGNTDPIYDSLSAPAQMGSGGGNNGVNPGAPGGGYIRLEVGGTLALHSHLYADGAAANLAGSGAGGSVYITCATLAGSANIYARGGDSFYNGLPADESAGGGGGGRVAIIAGSSSWTGSVAIHGGYGQCGGVVSSGGPGTFYWHLGTDHPVLTIANAGRSGVTVLPALNMPDTAMQVRETRGLVVDCSAQPLSVYSLLVVTNSTISHPAGSVAGLHIVTTADLQVDGWCYLDVSGKGYAGEAGPGAGSSGGGGTHGGNGQGNTAPLYDSITAPAEMGSGGGNNGVNPGAPGGGYIRLEVGGTLVLNSHLYADGAAANWAGSGAGGSVYITCATLAGGGSIYARGGDSFYNDLPDTESAGGGGGGRVAIIAGSSSWTGSVAIHGGYGKCGGVVSSGGPGTFYRRIGADRPALTIANAGRGGLTLLPALNMPDTIMQVRETRGLVVDCSAQPLSVYSLLVTSNSTISHPAGSAEGLHIVTAADLQVDGWCYLDVTGKGYAGEAGPGAGSSGGGGTHGGNGQGNADPIYDALTAPVQLGSGGGNNGANPGAPGGGCIRLEVGGTLALNGHLYADGAAANWAGSGAGGSVYITCATLAGGASIYARGGDSFYNDLPDAESAGGGGGGRVAIITGSSSWTGSVAIHGGYGKCGGVVSSGGPGTFYRRIGADRPALTIANAGRGGLTLLPALNMPDTAMQVRDTRGLVVDCSAQPLSVYSLLVTSNSTISHPAGSVAGLHIVTTADLQVDGWCYLDVSGKGYGADSGPGYGISGQGAAYGGSGGNGNNRTYGSVTYPQHLGSGGGSSGANTGGAGGGRVTLMVGGTLTVNGQVICDGAGASGAGAGSGGTILVVAGNVVGGGRLLARGGGATGGGGGGGGRIASLVPSGASALPSGGANVDRGSGGDPPATQGTVYIGQPADLTFDGPGAFQWQDDGSGKVTVRVVNPTPVEVPGFDVALYDRNPALGGAVLLTSANVPGLPAYGSADVELTGTVPPELTQVWVMADSGHAVPEQDEGNNTLAVPVPTRTETKTYATDRTGTITEQVTLRGYCYRKADSAPLSGKTLWFYVDGSFLGTAVTGTSGRADYNWIISEGPASRAITVKFNGDATYGPSQGTGTLTCQSWGTKMATFNRTARITDRTELKCRLLRSDNVPLFNKSINFYVDGTFVITRPTNVDGYASYPYYDVPDGAGAGTRTILSEWVGNGGYAPISKTATLTVLKALPYIWVLPKSVPQGAIANLYAYFRRLYDYKKQEGKTVSFRIDGTWIADVVTGSGTSEPGVARYFYNTSGLAKGTHTIRCEFAGDAWVEAGYGEGGLTIY